MWQKALNYLNLQCKKLDVGPVTVNRMKVGLMIKYILAASVAAVMATGASASTMTMQEYGNGFYWGADPEFAGNGVFFGPSLVYTTFVFDRGGDDFYFD